MTIEHVPVLISGAGYAGLTAALMLSLRGVPCLLAERRGALSDHPRAHGFSLRSLELLRQAPGLEKDLLLAARAEPGDTTIMIAETVGGPPIEILAAPNGFDTRTLSPAPLCSAGQDRAEPVLLRHARAHGADIRFSTELLSFSQDAEKVHAVLRDAVNGRQKTVVTDYLIAADGSSSPVRTSLAVDMKGRSGVSHAISILFKADLSASMAGRGFFLCYLRNRELTGAFVSCDDPDQGQLNVEYDPAREAISDFDAARCIALVRAALGQSDLEVEILSVLPWRMSALLADRMKIGRVFLAGDAAHIMPPVGGLAGQAAIQDAADLAWKISMVTKKQADPTLLDTYEDERRPVAQLSIARAMENYVRRLRQDRDDLGEAFGRVSYLDVAMSYRYRSRAISVEEPDDGLPADDTLHPSGKPGSRLAHVPLIRDGVEISTHDLVGRGFALLAGPAGSSWVEAAKTLAQTHGVATTAFGIGVDLSDPTGTFLERTGLEPAGALLLRPDGFIAWRSLGASGDTEQALRRAYARALCLDRSQLRIRSVAEPSLPTPSCETSTTLMQ